MPGAAEVPLELLSTSDAARLLLTVAGVPAEPPYADGAVAAAEACGRLPLTLAVAGGILADQVW